MEFYHVPVLLEECLKGLALRPDGIYVDGTAGGGGHSFAIASRLETGRLLAVDRDEEAVAAAARRLEGFGKRARVFHNNFENIPQVLDEAGIDGVDGILLDLGVSSHQLDEGERGFSYQQDAPLDMRMDRSSGFTAFDAVNGWNEQELADVIFRYGEERYSRRIAAEIVRRRKEKPVATTLELVDAIRSAMPAAALREKQHPAKRTFQALRIAVNDELGALSEGLDAAMDALAPGGRLAVISFHSLEDRIVKNAVRMRENGCTCPPDLPVCVCGFVRTMRTVTKKPIVPSAEEIERNPRARSAKLRIAEKL